MCITVTSLGSCSSKTLFDMQPYLDVWWWPESDPSYESYDMYDGLLAISPDLDESASLCRCVAGGTSLDFLLDDIGDDVNRTLTCDTTQTYPTIWQHTYDVIQRQYLRHLITSNNYVHGNYKWKLNNLTKIIIIITSIMIINLFHISRNYYTRFHDD